jgi:hypothetical protein
VRETVHIIDPALEECARLAAALADDAVCVQTWDSSEQHYCPVKTRIDSVGC